MPAAGVGGGSSGYLVTALIVLFVLYRQFRVSVFRAERVVVMPLLLVLVTALEWSSLKVTFTPTEWWITAGTVAFALAAGYGRGRAVRMERRPDGAITVLGGWGTVIIYAATLAIHVGLDAAFTTSASNTALAATLPLYLVALMAGRLAAMLPRARALQAGA